MECSGTWSMCANTAELPRVSQGRMVGRWAQGCLTWLSCSFLNDNGDSKPLHGVPVRMGCDGVRNTDRHTVVPSHSPAK